MTKQTKIFIGVGALAVGYIIYKYVKCPDKIVCVHRNPMATYTTPEEPKHPYCNNLPFICRFKTKIWM